jgi:hypothetical protein
MTGDCHKLVTEEHVGEKERVVLGNTLQHISPLNTQIKLLKTPADQ